MIGGLGIQQMTSHNSLQPQTPQFLQFRFPTHPTNNKVVGHALRINTKQSRTPRTTAIRNIMPIDTIVKRPPGA
jgi:hypothetical protein